jgi:4-amino-4-deoxy-L-arabinose transferase-like glycosyltransferase
VSNAAFKNSSKSWRLAAAIVLGLAAIIFFTRLGSRALWASEFRWAEIAREMRLSGNYFWPTIDGRVYYDKPLGTYWLVIAATHITGAMNETAARIPSAAAGLLSVLFLMLLVNRMFDWKHAVLSGFILSTSYSFVFFSRHASADVETIAGELLALLLFVWNEESPEGWWVVWLWIVMAVTSLTKGLLGFVLPMLVIGSYCLLAEGWAEFGKKIFGGTLKDRLRWIAEAERWFFNWKTIPAALVGGSIYVAPFIISRELMNSDQGLYLVYRENVLRYFEPFDHRGPIYLYVFVIFLLMAPWSVLLPAALTRLHTEHDELNDRNSKRRDRFVMVYFWATFIFFTLSGSRRSYYLLPILPAAAIIVANLSLSPMEKLKPLTRRLMLAGYLVLASAALLGIIFVIPPALLLPEPWSSMPPAPDRIIFSILWLVAAGSVVYALARLDPRRIAISTGIISYVTMVYIFIFAMPATEAYRPEKPFAAVVAAKVGPSFDGLAFYRNLETFFYLNPPYPIPEYDNRWALNKATRNGRIKWLMIKKRDIDDLKLPGEVVAEEPVYPWDGEKGVRNRVLLLRISPVTQPR